MRSKFSSFDPTRRQMIRSMVSGSTLLPAILQQCLAETGDDLAPRAPHFPPKAKRVIFMLASGGASHNSGRIGCGRCVRRWRSRSSAVTSVLAARCGHVTRYDPAEADALRAFDQALGFVPAEMAEAAVVATVGRP